MLKDGMILLWDKRKSDKGITLLLTKLICKITKSPISHSAIYLNGRVFEQDKRKRGRQGLIVSKSGMTPTKPDYFIDPPMELNGEDILSMEDFILFTYSGYNYNTFKMLLMAVVQPFKKLFTALNWVPFDKPWFGEICSVMPDEAYKHVGKDLFPGEHEGYTVPGDYLKLVKNGI